MNTYIALLRGINVSGAKAILMADLKKLCEGLGFKSVQTYIQSGNVVFQSDQKGDLILAASIEKAIQKKYGFDVPVIIRSKAEMEKILVKNPYAKAKLKGEERLYVTLLAEAPGAEAKAKLAKAPMEKNKAKDEYTLSGTEIYLLIRGGYGESFLSNAFFEKILGIKATTRNQATMEKLTAMAHAL